MIDGYQTQEYIVSCSSPQYALHKDALAAFQPIVFKHIPFIAFRVDSKKQEDGLVDLLKSLSLTYHKGTTKNILEELVYDKHQSKR